MPTTYFTSDTHFDDPRVLRIDRRPFADLDLHDETLIRNWNERVKEDDEVFHLGDVMSTRRSSPETLLARLNGRKHLIVGNNDPQMVQDWPGWASVRSYLEMELDGHFLILCHYPFRTWNRMGKGSVNLHGHSHGRLKPMPRQFDVGVDPQALYPVTLAEILASRTRGRKATAPVRPDPGPGSA
ncbi:metallophosphoesterase family protein [Rhizobium sp. SAFR-030]|uniref:metallophosphoesterase family protein n=1 Tax=Rhizobium sp. SAFR-030 TaxID=3387277 RepID=UPI003F7E57CC